MPQLAGIHLPSKHEGQCGVLAVLDRAAARRDSPPVETSVLKTTNSPTLTVPQLAGIHLPSKPPGRNDYLNLRLCRSSQGFTSRRNGAVAVTSVSGTSCRSSQGFTSRRNVVGPAVVVGAAVVCRSSQGFTSRRNESPHVFGVDLSLCRSSQGFTSRRNGSLPPTGTCRSSAAARRDSPPVETGW